MRWFNTSQKHVGTQSISFPNPPSIAASACVVGKKEGEGPLRDSFDYINDDSFFGEKTWEKAESTMQKMTLNKALEKASLPLTALDFIFAGDLLNQCIGSAFSLRDIGIPFFGLYGACSTMAESLTLAAMAIDGGYADCAAAITSSHFCSAERQFRLPLEYGGQRTPTAQWTVTGSGAIILTSDGPGPYIKHVTVGKIVDQGIKDANNMGAAMAPAAYSTLSAHFSDLSLKPSDYDLIVTGDLAMLGAEILVDFFRNDGIDLSHNYNDCGLMIYSREEQDVHAGGSGCGCSASVLSGHLLNGMRAGRWKKILFAATGALLSPTSTQQGESIPCICCAVSISATK
jgi:stage V sporulation protein AD